MSRLLPFPAMDIYAIRRRRLADAHALPALARLTKKQDRARLLDLSPSMYSQLLNPAYRIGDDIARKIEAHLGLRAGWMDGLNDSREGTVSEPSNPYGLASQFQRPDPAILVEAERWALIFQAATGAKFSDLERMERVAEVYGQIVADGGSLSDQHHQAYLRQLEDAVNRRGEDGQADKVGRSAAKRRAAKR